MPRTAAKPVLRFEHVTVSFDDVRGAARTSRSRRSKGESRVILGAAGSGKTVLLKTALGLVQARFRQGLRLRRGPHRACSERELFDIRSKIGMLFQESALFDSLTIEENVAYPLLNQKSIHCPPEQVLPRVEEALEFVELGGTLEKFPSELSGGMRRRAAIARAVVTEPPLVLYDSPTAGLDPITAHTIIALLIKERDVNTDHHPDGDASLSGRESDREFPLQFETRGSGAGAQRGGAGQRTTFMVLREGRLVFEGGQDRAGSVAGSVHFEVREAAGIDDAGSQQQSTLVAVEGRSGRR